MPLSAYEVFFSPENRIVTLKLIRYSMMMLLVPLATFYISFYVIFKQNADMLGWCGIFAALSANVVIVAYVLMAWNEEPPKDSSPKRSTTDKAD
jgi:hypothetical protein